MAFGGPMTPKPNFLLIWFNAVQKTIERSRVSTDPSDGLVLKLHYKWTFWYLLGSYLIIFGNWFHKDIMVCVSKFEGDELVRPDYLEFCYSYMYVQQEDNPEEKRYLFFYKWLPYVNVILAFWYYMPRKLNKAFYKPLLTNMCNMIHKKRPNYDEETEKNVLTRVSTHINEHMWTNNSIYFNALLCNVFALFVNFTGIFTINFVLQGRFISYGWNSLPFNRDVVNFTDPMSQTFPPFAQCTIGRQHELIAGRVESFGCHLIFMELYEKLYLVLWLWLMVLAFMTTLYIIFLVLLFIPAVRRWALKVQKPEIVEGTIFHDDLFNGVLHNCKIGDVWLLYKLKKNMSATKYYMLLCQLSEPSLRDILRSHPAYRADDLRGVQQPLLAMPARPRGPKKGKQVEQIMMHNIGR